MFAQTNFKLVIVSYISHITHILAIVLALDMQLSHTSA